jgi:serine/threonine protein kinase
MDGRVALPRNTLLDGTYRVEGVIGAGGFGITYEAEDVKLRTRIALKEYYPAEFGNRDATMSVQPKSERHRTTFEWGRASFLQEAQTLARFKHPSIVRVTRVFEALSTAYMVMDFETGEPLEAWLKRLGRSPTQGELDRITAPVLDALELMHAADFLHRDIAPDNIIVRGDGSPVLLDFGAARRAVAEKSRTLTGIVKAGYSPHEQYASDSRNQGPWSDIYALGATLYRAVTGKPPEESTLRVGDDRLKPIAVAAAGHYRPGFLKAIESCLRVRPSERPQSIAQLRPMLLGQETQPISGTKRIAGTRNIEAQPPGSTNTKRAWVAGAAVLAVLAGAYVGLEYTRRSAEEQARHQAEARRQEDSGSIDRRAESKISEARRQADAEAARRMNEPDPAAAKKRADDEAEARRKEDERLAGERRAAEDREREQAEAKRRADALAQTVRCNTALYCPKGMRCLADATCGVVQPIQCWSGDVPSVGGGCRPAGAVDCKNGAFCGPGERCTPGGCSGGRYTGPDCKGNGRRCHAGELCNPFSGNCYDPRRSKFCGRQVCHIQATCGENDLCLNVVGERVQQRPLSAFLQR